MIIVKTIFAHFKNAAESARDEPMGAVSEVWW